MMKHYILLFFTLVCTLPALAQFNPQSKKVTKTFFSDYEALENVTPALQKKKGYTNYEELMSYLKALVAQHPENIRLDFIGESQKGKDIPVLYLTTNTDTPKIKVWMQGGLHGNEPASTEGMLYVLHQILNNPKYKPLLDNVSIAMVPMANIDGYLKQDRYAANGLDLNRDQTKLMAPETVALKQAFTDFKPEVGLDFHEYRPYRKDFMQLSDFGITSLFDAMFLYTGNLNVPENLRTLTNTLFVAQAKAVLDSNNLKHHDYVSTGKFDGEIHFNQGSTNARSSATNYALTNTISTLFEIRGVGIGRTSFKRRIQTTFLLAMSYLETASANVTLIKEEIKQATAQQNEVVVTSKKTIAPATITTIDLDTNTIIELPVTIRDGLRSQPDLVRSRPTGYLIDANETALIEKLKLLGVLVSTLPETQEINVESYRVTAYKRASKKYEKMNLQTVETALEPSSKTFPMGTYKIETNQKNASIIFEVLEPEAPNSFVSFGLLNTQKEAYLPIYRITN